MNKTKKRPSINDFLSYARPILKNKNFIRLKEFNHHGNISCYKHVITVAYIAYKKNINKNIDINSLIKVCLLHDYYLYDWHIKGSHKGLHGYNHPKISANNANKDFGLNKREIYAIKSHMWPLTLFHIPTSKIGWILCIADKKATNYDYFKKQNKKL